MKIRLVMLGKTRRAEVRALLEEYLARIRHFCAIEVQELRDPSALSRTGPCAATLRKLRSEPGATWVLLDAGGRQLTSQQFAGWLADLRDRGTRELVFLCGNATGFPEELRRGAHTKLSLSTLTMAHELARVVLAEQLYRAFTISHGLPYNK